MFIGIYTLDGKTYNNIYDKKNGGFQLWHSDTFSPECENIMTLDLSVIGKTYTDKKSCMIDLAIQWQGIFSQYSWSYYELYMIQNWFFENGKRYGLLKEFKENAIC